MKRRQFLQSSATVMAGATLLPDSLFASARKVSAADKIRIGLIGVNGMGWSNLNSVLKDPRAQCIALCDVDSNILDKRVQELAAKNIQVSAEKDYRKLLDNKDIDAVIIGTPDHWHCKIMVDACAAGKDVYVEKPVGNSIAECNVMEAAQQKYGRVVQVGQWQRSNQHFADAVDFVRSGKLGNIRMVKTWAYIGWKSAVPVKPDAAPPPGVDYERWLGPARKRPFNPNRFHFNFRWYWDYAGGLMTDWGVHLIDYALLGMNASTPRAVIAAGGKFAYPDDASETPDTMTAVFEFNGFNIQWEQAIGIDKGPYDRAQGIAFIGNNGTLVLDRGGWEVQPEIIDKKQKMDAVARQSRSDNGLDRHMVNFLDTIQSRRFEDLRCPIQAGAHIARVSQMGNIAFRTGKKLHWDAAKGKFSDSEANKYLAAEYHNGYKMPTV